MSHFTEEKVHTSEGKITYYHSKLTNGEAGFPTSVLRNHKLMGILKSSFLPCFLKWCKNESQCLLKEDTRISCHRHLTIVKLKT